MSKAFELSQRSEEVVVADSRFDAESTQSESPVARTPPDLELEMFSLYQAVDSRLPKNDERIVAFVGPEGGEGTSTISWAFAVVAATRFGKSVLLLHADPEPVDDTSIDREGADFPAPTWDTQHGLWVSALLPARSSFGSPPRQIIGPYLGGIEQNFQLIVVDSGPPRSSTDGFLSILEADGVILVLEADKTGVTTSEQVCRMLEARGAHLLGVVLNKQRYYVPRFLRERL